MFIGHLLLFVATSIHGILCPSLLRCSIFFLNFQNSYLQDINLLSFIYVEKLIEGLRLHFPILIVNEVKWKKNTYILYKFIVKTSRYEEKHSKEPSERLIIFFFVFFSYPSNFLHRTYLNSNYCLLFLKQIVSS